jgi:hypothetical protein
MQTVDSSPFTLAPGERLLWSGAPIAIRILRVRVLVAVLIGAVILTRLYGVFQIMVKGGEMDASVVVFLIALALVLIVGIPLVAVLRNRRTKYAITSDHLLMLNTVVSRFVKAFPLETITDIRLTERADGSGDIAIGRRFLKPGWQDPRLMSSRTGLNGLLNIPDAKRVHEILLAAREARLAAVA